MYSATRPLMLLLLVRGIVTYSLLVLSELIITPILRTENLETRTRSECFIIFEGREFPRTNGRHRISPPGCSYYVNSYYADRMHGHCHQIQITNQILAEIQIRILVEKELELPLSRAQSFQGPVTFLPNELWKPYPGRGRSRGRDLAGPWGRGAARPA